MEDRECGSDFRLVHHDRDSKNAPFRSIQVPRKCCAEVWWDSKKLIECEHTWLALETSRKGMVFERDHQRWSVKELLMPFVRSSSGM